MLPALSDPESLTPVTDSSASTAESESESDADTDTDADSAADETTSTLELLGDQHRRAVLEYLVDCNEDEQPIPLADLADHVTLAVQDEDTGTLAGCGDALLGTRRRVQISLRHRHVPKLAMADAVDFDLESNSVILRESGAELLARANAIDRATDGCNPKPNAQ